MQLLRKNSFFQNGFIECEKDCPAVDDCYALVKKSPEICCDKCKGKINKCLQDSSRCHKIMMIILKKFD